MLSHMALGEAGLWATEVNDDHQIVLVIKLGTDTLKWIHRGVPVNMLIGHVHVDNAWIRVLGLEVFDCKTNPLVPNLPQVETWEIERFDTLLGKSQFPIHFHNEQPFVSVLDATASLPLEAVLAYIKKRADFVFYTAPIVTGIFQKAQEAFEQAVRKENKEPVSNAELFRLPISIANPIWNSIEVLEAGTFVPEDSNEGRSHEALLLHVLKPNFDGIVLASPQIREGDKTRELCDVLAIAKNAFIFEAKAFSVFDKSPDQTAERKASTVMKHFEKALGQLQGAVKRVDNGVEIVGAGAVCSLVSGGQFQTLHGIAVVSNTSFDLPWQEIGKQLANAQKPPHIYFHFIPLLEVQRMVAFTKGSSDELNLMFIRRAEIITSSKNAHVRTEYIPEVPSVMKLPPVPGNCMGLRFVWVGDDAGDWLVRFFPLVYRQLRQRDFSGRLDFYHKIGMARGLPALGIGLAAHSVFDQLPRQWWSEFHHDLFQSLTQAGLPKPAPNSEQIQTLAEITLKFPDLLLSAEFQEGSIVAKNAGDRI